MPNKQIQIPGKTFLVGEYGVLQGGPALIATTEPCFYEIKSILTADQTGSLPHPESPAGRLLLDHGVPLSSLEVFDPYEGQGGLGASTAQFLLAWQKIFPVFDVQEQWPKLLKEYRRYATFKGRTPSGADLLAQAVGGVALVDEPRSNLKALDWPFAHLHFTLLRTGHKVATHQHLSEMKDINYSSLIEIARRACHHFELADETGFVASIQDFAKDLSCLGLVLPATQNVLKQIQSLSEVLAAKGCGALGADIILLLHRQELSPDFLRLLQELSLRPLASDTHLFRKQ